VVASVSDLTLREGNDEIIDVVINAASAADDLTLVTRLEVVIKPDVCTADTASSAVMLSSVVPAEIVITSQTVSKIVAVVFVPATVLAQPYERVWRCDVRVGAARRTALYGRVIMIDL
jgi:hypothetical protein